MSYLWLAPAVFLSWSIAWGYEPAYLGAAMVYLSFAILVPGCLLNALVLPAKDKTLSQRLVMGMLWGILLCLVDYFAAIFLFSPKCCGVVLGTFYLVAFLSVGFSPRARQRIKALWQQMRRTLKDRDHHHLKLVCLTFAVCFGLYVAVFSIFRVNPETWQGPFIINNVDMNWHIAMATRLTEDFPVRVPNFFAPYYYVYHCLPHVLTAHLSNIFGLHASLAFLQCLPLIICFFAAVGIVLFLQNMSVAGWALFAASFASLFFAQQGISTYNAHLIMGESSPLAFAMIALSLALMPSKSSLLDVDLPTLLTIGLGLGFATVAKGSCGPVFVIGLYALAVFDMLHRRKAWSIASVVAFLAPGAVALLLYKIFFHGSIHTGGFYLRGMPTRELAACLLAIASIFALPAIIGRWREGMFLGSSALASLMLYFFVNVYGNEHYFLVNIYFASVLAVGAFLGWVLQRVVPRRWQVAAALIVVAVCFSSSHTTLRWLDRPTEQQQKHYIFNKDTFLDQDLFKVLQALRDKTPKDALLLHRHGTDLETSRTTGPVGVEMFHNLQSVTAFSERVSFLGYMPQYVAHAYGFIVKEKRGEEQLKWAEDVIKTVFAGNVSAAMADELAQLKKPLYFVGTEEEWNIFQRNPFLKSEPLLRVGRFLAVKLSFGTQS